MQLVWICTGLSFRVGGEQYLLGFYRTLLRWALALVRRGDYLREKD